MQKQFHLPQACPNCDAFLDASDNFCAGCGQQVKDRNVGFKLLITDFIDELFNLEAKHIQTFVALLRHPGRLTLHFMEGKIARYILPFRLFLFVSVVSLALLGYNTSKDVDKAQKSVSKNLNAKRNTTINFGYTYIQLTKEEINALPHLNDQEFDELMKSKDLGGDRLAKAIVKKVPLLTTKEGINSMSAIYYQLFSYLQFALMPVFAWILMLLFSSKVKLYVFHFVHAIHIHSTQLFFTGLAALLKMLTDFSGMAAVQFIGLIYAFISILNVYKESLGKTLLKFAVTIMMYMVILIPLIVVLALVSILMI